MPFAYTYFHKPGLFRNAYARTALWAAVFGAAPTIVRFIAGRLITGSWRAYIDAVAARKPHVIAAVFTLHYAAMAAVLVFAALLIYRGALKSALCEQCSRVSFAASVVYPVAAASIFIAFNILYFNGASALGFKPPAPYLGKIVEALRGTWYLWYLGSLIVIVFPVLEEVMFRGLVFDVLRAKSSYRHGAFWSSVFFALFHWQAYMIVPLFFLGESLSWLKEKYKSVIPCIICHCFINLFAFCANML